MVRFGGSSSIRPKSAIRAHQLSLPETQSGWEDCANRLMLAGDDRPLQADAVRFRSAVLVTRGARSRTSRALPPTECAAPKSSGRFAFSTIDRLAFAGMCALAPNILDAVKTVKPETALGRHRAGFRPIGAGNRDHGAGAGWTQTFSDVGIRKSRE
jgi:hypothetical protein